MSRDILPPTTPDATIEPNRIGLIRQCLAERMDQEDLQRHVAAWEEERNERGDQIKWRFTTADARIKLRRLYPTL